jgi:hypothetical protein
MKPRTMTFDPTYEPGESRLISGTPYIHPRYKGSDLLFDVGVVVLDEPFRTGAGYAKLPSGNLVDTLEKGTYLTAVGYGATDWDVGGGQPQPVYPDARYRATVTYLGTSWDLGYIPEELRDSWMKVTAGSMGEGGEGQCYGDSGGPNFLPDQRTLVGVTSFGASPLCTGVGGLQRVDLPVVLTWVRSFL